MGVSIEDLKPKPFTVELKGQEITCQPLRLSDALCLSKVGEILQNSKDASRKEIKQAEADLDELIADLMPELATVKLDMSSTISLITQMMETIEPSDNKELREEGVDMNTDPKAPTSE